MNGFKSLCNEMKEALTVIYVPDDQYKEIALKLCDVQKKIESSIDYFTERIGDANGMTLEWAAMFNNAKTEADKKEVLRKDYDHYEQKLEKMYEQHDKKKGTESAKELEKLVRVIN